MAHREFDRVMKESDQCALALTESGRREIRRHEHEIKMLDLDIELARAAKRSIELDIELLRLKMPTLHSRHNSAKVTRDFILKSFSSGS